MRGRQASAVLLMLLLATQAAAQPTSRSESATNWACRNFRHIGAAYAAERDHNPTAMPGDCMPVEPDQEIAVLRNEGALAWVNICAAHDGCFTAWLPTSVLQQRESSSRGEAPGTR
jgi:hypothetical protein